MKRYKGGLKSRGRAFEDHLDLCAIVDHQLDDEQIGAYILGNPHDPREPLQFRIGFKTPGFDPEVDEKTAEILLSNLEQGFIHLPEAETLTLICRVFGDDRDRQARLEALRQKITDRHHKLCVLSEKAKIQDLTIQGERQLFSISVFVTYTFAAPTGKQSHIEKTLNSIPHLITKYLESPDERLDNQKLATLLQEGFRVGYPIWKNLFARMGLIVEAMNGEELWREIVQRFHRGAILPIPQHLVISKEGVVENVKTVRDPRTVLTRPGLPEAHDAYVKVNGDYIGSVVMIDKPDGWSNPRQQLRFVFEALSQPGVRDTELVVEFSKADAALHNSSLQLLTRQSNVSMAKAEEQDATDVMANFKRNESIDARQRLIEGKQPIYVGLAFLVHRASPAELETACQRLASSFAGGVWMEHDTFLAWNIWLQSLPITRERLLVHNVFDQRILLFSDEATAFMPLLQPSRHDSEGLELLTAEGGHPIYLDFYNPHPILSIRSLGIFAATRAGKSVLVGQILLQALIRGLPVTVIDYPKPDGTSTYTDLAKQMNGAYFDVATEASNIFELPSLETFPAEEQHERLNYFIGALLPVLKLLVMGSDDYPRIIQESINAVLKIALAEFFRDACIMARYRAAHRAGLGSADWQKVPTLADFFRFLEDETLPLDKSDPHTRDALQLIKLQLRSWLNSPGVGRAISRASTVRMEAGLVVFALTNINDPQEAAILAMSAYLMALRRSLSAKASIFFIDESPILLKFKEISLMLGRICANGGKAGISVIVSAQDPDTIAASATGSQILQNLNTRLIGCIQPAAISSFERILNYPRDVIRRNASQVFMPNPQGLYSQWLLDDGGQLTHCRFYPPAITLALTANNPNEQRARSAVMSRFQDNLLVGIATFADLLTQAIRTSEDLENIVARWQETTP